MTRGIHKLTALEVGRLKLPGMYSDGGGLYLQIKDARSRSWVFRYRFGGRKTPRDLGLGSAVDVSLAAARAEAAAQRDLIRQGHDPIEARKAAKAAVAQEKVRALTFKECAEAFLASKKDGWRNEKHRDQWAATLTTYAYPLMGDVSIADVGIDHVVRVLEQPCGELEGKPKLWIAKTETASRLRGRVENVLDWATAREYRSGDNPARWRGRLDKLLPAKSKIQKVQHHPALPYQEIGAFVAELRRREATAARALEFLILTAARTSEVTGVTWGEFDLNASLWTVPPERMKSGREHRVPLSARAVAILRDLGSGDPDGFVFPGGKVGKRLSENAFLALLERMKRDDLTAHGFRSTFRDWAAERTAYPSDVCEMALAHVIESKVEAAYRRSDLLERRRRLMSDWATYCDTVQAADKVIGINRVAS